MSLLKGVNRTLADTPVGSNIIAGGLQKGKLRIMSDSIELAAAQVGDIIEVNDFLPIGAKVHEVVLMADALGGSVTLAVGDYESAARYISATAMNTANKITRLNAIGGRQYEVDETTPGSTSTDRQIIITVAGAAASGSIKIDVIYSQE